jgi:hypothetical protein
MAVEEGRRSGYAHFPVFNASSSFLWYSKDTFDANFIESIFDDYEIQPQDIFIFNYGIHSYQDWSKIRTQLKEFQTAVSSFHLKQSKEQEEFASSHPHHTLFFFLETFPQHFTNEYNGNGYYYVPQASEHCVPHTASPAKQYELDIRNRIADEIFLSSSSQQPQQQEEEVKKEEEVVGEEKMGLRKSDIPIIRVVEGLSSQYDAHVEGGENIMINAHHANPHFDADCTHWCAQAGMFQYVHRVVYNYIKHFLHHHIH